MEAVREAVRNAIAAVTVRDFTAGLLLRSFPIYLEEWDGIARTDGKAIYITERFAQLPPPWQTFVLVHELGHIVSLHLQRTKAAIERRGLPESAMLLANIAADLVTDMQVIPSPLVPGERREELKRVVEAYDLPDPSSASFEEVFEALLKRAERVNVEVIVVQLGRGEGGQRSCGVSGGKPRVGDRDLSDRPSTRREVVQEGEGEPADEREIARRVAAAVHAARMAGREPGGWERVVSALLRPAVDWKQLLRFYLQRGVGRSVKRTWYRPSRKCPELRPGKETLRLPRVIAMVDTSGSVTEGELRRFITEVYAIVKDCAEVVVVPWDAQAYAPIRIRRPSDVARVRLTGGGGTVLGPALRAAEKLSRPQDVFVILSDWAIADVESPDPEVLSWLRRNAKRVIAATVCRQPPPFLRTVTLPRGEKL
ncbi:MAG: VWA-like domain-containing protein [Thermofilaceae archaeon]